MNGLKTVPLAQFKSPPPLTQEEAAKNTYTNSLGMKFLPVPGTKVLFCIHETRQGDYAAYAVEVTDLNDHWRRNRGPSRMIIQCHSSTFRKRSGFARG